MNRSQLILSGAIKPAPKTSKPQPQPTTADLARQRGVSLSQVRRERAADQAPKALATLALRQVTRTLLQRLEGRIQARAAANLVLDALNRAITSRS